MLTPAGLTNILENYAQIVEEKDPRTGRKKRKQVWPRYHQLGVVRQALADVRAHGAGKRYLIQHSAGSGKSNSIAWLAHQLIGLKRDDKEVFDSVIVVTDRRLLDDQIQTTIKQFMQVGATVGHAEHSGDLRKFIEEGKKIIVSTVQKFPFILDEIATEGGKTFAIVIDEAHSSQGGKTSAAMSQALGAPAEDEDAGPDPEDTVNEALEKRMAARKMLTNASYFAFTATPKNKTLEMFGEPLPPDAEGKVKHRPFHSYTMKQAVEEGFILDVLKSYTPVDSYYKLVKKTEDDPEFDTKKAQKKLRRYVESHDHAIRLKAEIMVDHFHEQVLAAGKIGGQARAMVVTSGIERAIQYFHAFKAYLVERKSPYQAIVAFSGEHEYGGAQGERGVAQRLLKQRHRRQDPDRPVPLPDLRRQVPDRLRRAAAAHDVRGQAALGHQGGADPVAAQPRAPAEARLLRARLPEQQRGDHLRLPGLLPHHAARRGDRPEQAARPEGGAGCRAGVFAGAGAAGGGVVPRRRGPRQARPDPRCVRGGLRGQARRGRPGGLQGQGQGVLPHLQLPLVGDSVQQRRVGEALDLPRTC